MKHIVLTKILSLILLASVAVAPIMPAASVMAVAACDGGTSKLTLLPPWYKGLQCDDKGTVQMDTGKNGLQSFIFKIVANLIEDLFYIVGYVSLAMIIWGGFKYMLFGDNSSGTEGAKKTILNAVIGLVISIFAVIIVNLVAGAF